MKLHRGISLFTMADAARAIGRHKVTLWRQVYDQGAVERPTKRVGRRYYYTAEQFGRIVAQYSRKA